MGKCIVGDAGLSGCVYVSRIRNSGLDQHHWSHFSRWTTGDYASGATADYRDAVATREVAWYSEGSTKDVVRRLRANGLGLYDMSGNVWEWCFPQSGFARVHRGGSWSLGANSMRVDYVSSYRPGGVSLNFGLRLARTQF